RNAGASPHAIAALTAAMIVALRRLRDERWMKGESTAKPPVSATAIAHAPASAASVRDTRKPRSRALLFMRAGVEEYYSAASRRYRPPCSGQRFFVPPF